MATLLWTRIRAITLAAALLAVAAVAAPAVASAAPHWNELKAPAPGGDDVVIAGGAPMVAYVAPDGVHVAQLSKNGKSWKQLGQPVRHTAGAQVFQPDLAVAPNGWLWLAWTELDAEGAGQARVARLDGSNWREVVGGARPINRTPDEGWEPKYFSAYSPDILFFGGRPYVAYVQDTPSEFTLAVRRLSADGSRWEGVAGNFLSVNRPGAPKLAVSGGRLYVATQDLLVPTVAVFRLDPATDRFVRLSDPNLPDMAMFGDLGNLGGRPGVLFTRYNGGPLEVWALGAGDAWQRAGGVLASGGDPSGQSLVSVGGVPYVAWLSGPGGDRMLHTAYLRKDGSWREITVPGAAGANALSARIVTSGRNAWLLWSESSAGGAVTWHVARLSGS